MVITRNDKKILGEIKQKINNYCVCPYCKEKFEVGIELDTLKQLNSSKTFPYPHIHLHGVPLHALLCYIDKDLNVRSASVVKSVEISRDSNTFKQITKKWSNPY